VTDGDESLIDSVDWGLAVENAGGAGGGPRWGRPDRRHPNFGLVAVIGGYFIFMD